MTVSYGYQIKGYFDKKGEIKSKRVKWVQAIEKKMKIICNYIINGSKEKEDNDNW